MPRRAGTTTASRRGALQTVDTNELPPVDEAFKAKKTTVSGSKAKELLCSIEEKEQENQALKSKTLELEDQVAALTEQLNSVQINANKQTGGPNSQKAVAAVPELLTAPQAPAIQAPRRYTTSYMHYCSANREKVKSENPEVSHMEVTKILGLRWKALPAFSEEIEHFNKLAEQDKARYDEEMRVYKTKTAAYEEERKALEYYNQQLKTQAALELYEQAISGTSAVAPSTASNKTSKAVIQPPKKPMSAFVCYSADKRSDIKAKNPGMEFAEVSKIVSEEWAKVQKRKNGAKKWNTLAAKDKERYEKELADYATKVAEQKRIEEERTRQEYELMREKALSAYRQKVESEVAVSQFKKNRAAELSKEKEERAKAREEKQKKKAEKALMPKRNMTAFFFFSNDAREHTKFELMSTHGSATVTEVSIELGRRWANLEQNKKDYYIELAAEDKLRYDAEMEEFNTFAK
ncbi:hypothetical protein NDN08_001603 [Rhodosorus marinus]|uniref:HMG box domain-containing protein n=1 Tax=Rhodosorus marinus TaxID=101924 RepID=A0AAV8UVI4_9RHOD|nr:hypothetical protein NDN08_001603 [Rhodosorus marinus]